MKRDVEKPRKFYREVMAEASTHALVFSHHQRKLKPLPFRIAR